jgi:predicted DNA-binding protein (UPF0251 family)
MGWRHRHRRGRIGRLPKPIIIAKASTTDKFTPSPQGNPETTYIDSAELEAFRLVDLEGLSQEEAGEKMGVSRGTVWRLVQSVRKKTAQALNEGRQIQLSSSNPEDQSSTQQTEE